MTFKSSISLFLVILVIGIQLTPYTISYFYKIQRKQYILNNIETLSKSGLVKKFILNHSFKNNISDNEFVENGKMYDIVKKSSDSNGNYIWAFEDSNESNIYSFISENTNHSDLHTKNTKLIKLKIQDYLVNLNLNEPFIYSLNYSLNEYYILKTSKPYINDKAKPPQI